MRRTAITWAMRGERVVAGQGDAQHQGIAGDHKPTAGKRITTEANKCRAVPKVRTVGINNVAFQEGSKAIVVLSE